MILAENNSVITKMYPCGEGDDIQLYFGYFDIMRVWI